MLTSYETNFVYTLLISLSVSPTIYKLHGTFCLSTSKAFWFPIYLLHISKNS